jgi:hypothetical protein
MVLLEEEMAGAAGSIHRPPGRAELQTLVVRIALHFVIILVLNFLTTSLSVQK